MKQILSRCFFYTFCCMTIMAVSSTPNKIFMDVHNNVINADSNWIEGVPVTVEVKQQEQRVSNIVVYNSKDIFYYTDRGPISFVIEGKNFGPYEINKIYGKSLVVDGTASLKKAIKNLKTDKMEYGLVYDIRIDLSTYSTSLPKKQKIRAYKTVNRDQDWVVRVVDKQGVQISESTFKKNTDRFAKNLYLQLNLIPFTDANDPKARFNENKIKVFKSKKPTENPDFVSAPITAEMFKPGSQIEITDDSVKIVTGSNEPKS